MQKRREGCLIHYYFFIGLNVGDAVDERTTKRYSRFPLHIKLMIWAYSLWKCQNYPDGGLRNPSHNFFFQTFFFSFFFVDLLHCKLYGYFLILYNCKLKTIWMRIRACTFKFYSRKGQRRKGARRGEDFVILLTAAVCNLYVEKSIIFGCWVCNC